MYKSIIKFLKYQIYKIIIISTNKFIWRNFGQKINDNVTDTKTWLP